MRYFFDTEFMEAGRDAPLRLISIGVVAEDGREYYAISTNALLAKQIANDWVKANVLPILEPEGQFPRIPDEAIGEGVRGFVGNDPTPELWSYFGDYDWVILCQLFGTMMDLPTGWPMFAWDVKQFAVQTMCEDLRPPDPDPEHHALVDARWIRDYWNAVACRLSEGGPSQGMWIAGRYNPGMER